MTEVLLVPLVNVREGGSPPSFRRSKIGGSVAFSLSLILFGCFQTFPLQLTGRKLTLCFLCPRTISLKVCCESDFEMRSTSPSPAWFDHVNGLSWLRPPLRQARKPFSHPTSPRSPLFPRGWGYSCRPLSPKYCFHIN